MNYSKTFDFVFSEVRKKKISCVLVGGFAINFYDVARQTTDIDFMITKDDFEKILPILESQGYRVTHQSEVFANLKSTDQHFIDLDYMFVEPDVFEKILQDGHEVKIGKGKFIVPSLNHLIALKLHSIKGNSKRELKDLPDIIGLIENNKVKVHSKSFKNLCLKYGSPDLLKKIRDFIGE